MRRTKIVATVGPASEAPETLDALLAAGADVVRINASHLDDQGLEGALAAVRDASRRAGRPIGAMVDLPGPKLRVGEMLPGIVLSSGAAFDLVGEECVGDGSHACVSWKGLARDVGPGDRVLLDDGRIVLDVTSTESDVVHTRVAHGGPLEGRKGVSVPGVHLSLPGVTARDLDVARWACRAEVDLVAQSFVRGPADIATVREALGEDGPALVAKIEKYEAVCELDAVVAAADAVMVARGDLGVEMPVEQVPVLQRTIVSAARAARKPVIVATQMLESMVHAAAPTRAEASDVATAIFEGADAVMLSAETAVGEYPVRAVEMMARIAKAAEGVDDASRQAIVVRSRDVSAAVSAAVVTLAENLEVAAIVTATRSGSTARAVAGYRPDVPVVAATTEPSTARRLTLVWGVTPLLVPTSETVEAVLDRAVEAVCDSGLVEAGELVALTAGIAVGVSGGTDFIRVVTA